MLINKHEDIKKYTELNTGVKFPSITPSIDFAEQAHIIPLIGKSLYNKLNTEYNANTTSGIYIKVLEAVQRALANLAAANYVPFADVQMSDAGITNASSSDQKAAFKYQVQNMQQAFLQRGLSYLDSLLALLDENVSTISEWSGSDEFKKYRSLFIQNGTQFKAHYSNTQYPRQLYMQLLSTMEHVEEFTIKPIISDAIFNALKNKLQSTTPNLTAEETELLRIIQKAVVFISLHDGIPQINVRVDDNGISVLSPMVDINGNNNRTATTDTQLSFFLNSAHKTGQLWLEKCVKYLDSVASATVFPTWFANMPQIGRVATIDNEYKKTIFSL